MVGPSLHVHFVSIATVHVFIPIYNVKVLFMKMTRSGGSLAFHRNNKTWIGGWSRTHKCNDQSSSSTANMRESEKATDVNYRSMDLLQGVLEVGKQILLRSHRADSKGCRLILQVCENLKDPINMFWVFTTFFPPNKKMMNLIWLLMRLHVKKHLFLFWRSITKKVTGHTHPQKTISKFVCSIFFS